MVDVSIGFVDRFDFKQPNQYLSELGMQSGSVIVNNLVLAMILLTLVIIHFYLFYVFIFTFACNAGMCLR